MIGVIDYGCGNLASLTHALARAGARFEVGSTPHELKAKDALLLPGVGNFGFAAQRLDDLSLRNLIVNAVRSGAPILGICLGMQLLFESSSEDGSKGRGLGILSGSVSALHELGVTGRVPHIGWNSLTITNGQSQLLDGVLEGDDVYFVHSFAVLEAEEVPISATTEYHGTELVAAVELGNVFGVQFHPEKSSHVGRLILQNFLDLVC